MYIDNVFQQMKKSGISKRLRAKPWSVINSRMKSLFYLDTSGLNFLADHINDFEAFSELKKHLDFELYLSPITLWEILLNSNDARRDYLIYWGQFNCAPHLLKSPAEIIINYIQERCPKQDRLYFRDSPYTGQKMGETWEKIHQKIDRTIPIDLPALKDKSKPPRQLSKNLKIIIDGVCGENANPKDPFHLLMHKAFKNLSYTESLTPEVERLAKLGLVLLFFSVCIGIELENEVIRKYWQPIRIKDPLRRLSYIIEKHPIILMRGPLLEMAKMAEIQISMYGAQSRGLVHDCFHTIYCYYADNFITGDEHFKTLRDNTKHEVFDRIIHTEQIEKLWHLTIQKLENKIS